MSPTKLLGTHTTLMRPCDSSRFFVVSSVVIAAAIASASFCKAKDFNAAESDAADTAKADTLKQEYLTLLEAGVMRVYDRRETLGEFASFSEESHIAAARLLSLKAEILNRCMNEASPGLFGDYAFLNRKIGATLDTCAAFATLAETDREVAEVAYLAAEDALAKHGQWATCREFLDVTSRLRLIDRRWNRSRADSTTHAEKSRADYFMLKKLQSLYSVAVLAEMPEVDISRVADRLAEVLKQVE